MTIKNWLGSAAVVSLALSTAYAPSAVSATAAPTAFSATLSGHAAIGGPTTFVFDGGGTASAMGQVRNRGRADVTGISLTCVAGLANTQVETLTDAVGDTLTLTSTDVGCPTGPLQFHGTGNWVVSGGTGRYANASGYGSLDGHGDFIAGTFTLTLGGTLILS